VCGTPVCTGTGWCWHNPSPAGWDLNGVWAFSPDDAWAIGSSGPGFGAAEPGQAGAYHWDGTRWRNAMAATVPPLTGIWASGPHDIWCPADDGSVWHFDGSSWTSTQVANGGGWHGISGSGPSDIWMVGHPSGFAHFDGQAWSLVTPPVVAIGTVVSTSASDAWAGGSRTVVTDGGFPQIQPVLLRYDGTSWSEQAVPLNGGFFGSLIASSALAPDDVYLTDGARTLHWNGSSLEWLPDEELVWKNADGTAFRLRMTQWAALDQRIGNLWVQQAATPEDELINRWTSGQTEWHFAGTSSQDMWIVGEGSRLYHWNGSALSTSIDTLTSADLTVIRGVGDEAWAAASDVLLHFDGSEWSKQSLGVAVTDVYAAAPGDAWMVGGLLIGELKGNLWTVRDQADGVLFAIAGTSSRDVWTAGQAGELRHFDGTTWQRIPTGVTDDLISLAAVAADEVWVGTSGNNLLHWNGVWTRLALSFKPTLWASGPSDVWASAVGAPLFHWDGSSWSEVLTQASGAAFAGTGPADVWLSDGFWNLWHFDGHQWTQETLPGRMIALYATPQELWGAGEGGQIIRRSR
jgi:hypothetical protein